MVSRPEAGYGSMRSCQKLQMMFHNPRLSHTYRHRRIACGIDELKRRRRAEIAHLVSHDKDVLLSFQLHNHRF